MPRAAKLILDSFETLLKFKSKITILFLSCGSWVRVKLDWSSRQSYIGNLFYPSSWILFYSDLEIQQWSILNDQFNYQWSIQFSTINQILNDRFNSQWSILNHWKVSKIHFGRAKHKVMSNLKRNAKSNLSIQFVAWA